MARPTKLDAERQQRIARAIQLGATYALAAKYGGITAQCFRNWLDRGARQSAGAYRDFAEAIARAEGEAAVGWLARIEQAALDGDWRAAMWKLERRYPADYGRTVQEHRHSFAVEREAERIAGVLGLSVAEVLAEATDILKGGG